MTFTEKAAGEMVERLRAPRAAGRDGADLPRPRPEPAAPLLAAAATTAQPLPELLDSKAPIIGRARAPAPRPLPVHAHQGPRRRDRVGEVPPHRARATTSATRGAAASRRSRSTCSSASTTGYERAKTRANRIDFDDLLLETVDLLEARRGGRRDRPRPQALVQRRRVPGHEPAPAAAAGAVAGRPRATCAWWATRTRRSTRSPARRRAFLTSFAERWPGRATVVRSSATTARRPRCSSSPTG